MYPDSRVHGANMGPNWGRQDPGGPHVGPVNFIIWEVLSGVNYLETFEMTIKLKNNVYIRPVNIYHNSYTAIVNKKYTCWVKCDSEAILKTFSSCVLCQYII